MEDATLSKPVSVESSDDKHLTATRRNARSMTDRLHATELAKRHTPIETVKEMRKCSH